MGNVNTDSNLEDEAAFRKGPAVRAFRLLWEYVVLFGALLFFGAGGLALAVVSAALYPVLPRKTGARLGRRTIQKLFRFFVRALESTGIVKFDLEAINQLGAERGLIIAPNHPSLLDAVLMISRLPDATCIMKAKIWHNPILGGGSRLAGYLRNDAPRRMIRDAAAELKDGHQLLVFPEGTRSRRDEGPINRFKGGFALIAREAGVPVQTVILKSNTCFLEKGWSVFRKPAFPLHYTTRLGRRFDPPEPGVSTKAFVANLERAFAAELGPPVDWKDDASKPEMGRLPSLNSPGAIGVAR